MQYKLSFLVLPLVLSCKKNAPPTERPFQPFDHTINELYLWAKEPWRATDTSNNSMASVCATIRDTVGYYQGEPTLSITEGGCYDSWPTEDKHVYTIRYMPELPLLDTAVIFKYGSLYCSINPALRNELLFEVVDTTVGKVYSHIYSRGSVAIQLSATVRRPNNDSLMAAYNYYLKKIHLAPKIFYRLGG